jgi:hypothetical protein
MEIEWFSKSLCWTVCNSRLGKDETGKWVLTDPEKFLCVGCLEHLFPQACPVLGPLKELTPKMEIQVVGS